MHYALFQNDADSDDDILSVRKHRSMVLRSDDEEEDCDGFDDNFSTATPVRSAPPSQETTVHQSPLIVRSVPATTIVSSNHSDSKASNHPGLLARDLADPCNISPVCSKSLPLSQPSPSVRSSQQPPIPQSGHSTPAQSATSSVHDVQGKSVSSGHSVYFGASLREAENGSGKKKMTDEQHCVGLETVSNVTNHPLLTAVSDV